MSFSRLPIYERLTTSWGGFILAVLLVLGFIACFEIIAFNHNVRLDLTPGQIYSLSEQTIKVLKNLEQDVQFTIFYKGGNRAYHEDFFSRLSIYSPRIKYRLIHLDRHPAKAKLYGVTGYDQMVAES
ncbi:MAG: Gldg family protein, partial [Deltaproteobacteria bacterium]